MALVVLTGLLALLLSGCGAHYDFVIHDNDRRPDSIMCGLNGAVTHQ